MNQSTAIAKDIPGKIIEEIDTLNPYLKIASRQRRLLKK